MKRIIIYFLLTCSVGLWANPAEKDSLKNDLARIDSAQTENVLDADNAYLTISDIDAIVSKIVEKMEQENKEKAVVIAKKIGITTGEIVIGVFILILGGVVWVLYNKLYKKLKNVEHRLEENYRIFEHKMPLIERNIVETERNVGKIRKVLIADIKDVVIKPTAEEKSFDENIKETYQEEPKNDVKTVYAKPLQDGSLKTTEELEAIYIISMYRDNTVGKFSLYEKDERKVKAIKNKDNMLDQFCDAVGSSMNARTIKNVCEGEVEQIRNGVWKVIKKAKIEFIK